MSIHTIYSTRMDLSKPACMRDDLRRSGDPLVKYDLPKPKGTRKASKERRKQQAENKLICEYDVLRLPSPTNEVRLQEVSLDDDGDDESILLKSIGSDDSVAE